MGILPLKASGNRPGKTTVKGCRGATCRLESVWGHTSNSRRVVAPPVAQRLVPYEGVPLYTNNVRLLLLRLRTRHNHLWSLVPCVLLSNIGLWKEVVHGSTFVGKQTRVLLEFYPQQSAFFQARPLVG